MKITRQRILKIATRDVVAIIISTAKWTWDLVALDFRLCLLGHSVEVFELAAGHATLGDLLADERCFILKFLIWNANTLN